MNAECKTPPERENKTAQTQPEKLVMNRGRQTRKNTQVKRVNNEGRLAQLPNV